MRHGWLTTIRADGSPRTARVWFVDIGSDVWIASGESTRKVADVERDPRVSFAVEGQHGSMSAVASVHAIDSAPEVLDRLRVEYGGWDAADPGVDGPRVLIRLIRRA